MAFGEIYKYTWWGKVITGGFGAIYQALISLVGTLLSALNNRAENYENNTATDAILVPLEDSGLLEKASIILTPNLFIVILGHLLSGLDIATLGILILLNSLSFH